MEWAGPAGLQSIVPAALSFGLSGYPYFHVEVAGYVQAGLPHDEERELWLRWLQLATWTATLRDHYGDHPVAPVDAWLDDDTLRAFRDAARIHNSLVPYLYTYAHEATRTGVPLMRYLPLEVPDDPRAWDEEQSFFLGPSLLVAPVVERGATTRTAYLPAGEWVDFWTGERYAGGQRVTVSAPLDGGRAPVFVRAGAILPLATELDTLSATDDAGVRAYAGDLLVRVFPGGGERELTLFDGTHLHWDGVDTLRVSDNARPRSVTVIAPDGASATRVLDVGSGEIRAP
jgi:alpha-glucosidase (family GH31 glycosyl hydrolase)